MKHALMLVVVLTLWVEALGQINYPLNPEPILPPGTDMNKGREPGLKKTPEHNLAFQLGNLFKAYAEKNNGSPPNDWKDLEHWLGAGVWDSKQEWEIIKRRFAIVTSSGSVPQSSDNGPIEGKLVLAPLYPIQEQRSAEQGRFSIWQSSKGTLATRWLTEAELRTFSNWPEVETKLNAAKAAVAQMPPLSIDPTPAPLPQANQPVESTPVAIATPPVAPSPTTPFPQTPALPSERKSPVWPWVVGMLALVVIVAVALKRRA